MCCIDYNDNCSTCIYKTVQTNSAKCQQMSNDYSGTCTLLRTICPNILCLSCGYFVMSPVDMSHGHHGHGQTLKHTLFWRRL